MLLCHRATRAACRPDSTTASHPQKTVRSTPSHAASVPLSAHPDLESAVVIVASWAVSACAPRNHLPKLSVDEMRTVVIENPVINSPFDEPKRHFRFSAEGITDEIVASRRVTSHFIPIASPCKKLPHGTTMTRLCGSTSRRVQLEPHSVTWFLALRHWSVAEGEAARLPAQQTLGLRKLARLRPSCRQCHQTRSPSKCPSRRRDVA